MQNINQSHISSKFLSLKTDAENEIKNTQRSGIIKNIKTEKPFKVSTEKYRDEAS
jgi:hypothetical protein